MSWSWILSRRRGCAARGSAGSCSREILPNILPPLVAEFGLRFCFVFLTISALSFLGLGIQPPTADWGSMVRENATLITYGDITPLLPAGAIALLTVAVNFVVDWFLHKTSGLQAMSTEHASRDRAKRRRRCSRSRACASRATATTTWHEIVKGVDLTLEARRGAGPDRRIGRRQVDHRARRHGLCRGPAAASPAARSCFDGIDLTRRRARPQRASSAARASPMSPKVAAASFNPAHRIIDQTIETARRTTVIERARQGREATPSICSAGSRLPDPEHIGHRYPHQVSGGQLQRAMTAMAMACRPDLIIFDEPTTALDVTTQIEVLAAIRDIVEQFNTAAIYITHDLAVVAQMADRIMVLRHGKLVEEAPTREHAARPAARTTPSRSGRCASSRKPRAARATSRCCAVDDVDRAYGGGVKVLRERHRRACRAAARSRSSANPAPASRRSPAPSPACCRRSQGQHPFRRQAVCRRRSKQRDKDMLRRIQMIYQMPDTALNPRQTRARHHRPAARVLSRPAAASALRRAGRRAARA